MNKTNESNYRRFKELPEVVDLVEQSWGKPGQNILCNKLLPSADKMKFLNTHIGDYGPSIDLLMRAMIPQMMILHMTDYTGNISSKETGTLHRHIKSKLRKQSELLLLISSWFGLSKVIKQFDHTYRTLRCEILISQVKTLHEQPKSIVRIFICLILYLKVI